MNVWAWYALAGVLVALGAYLIGYSLFKVSHRSDVILDEMWLDFQRFSEAGEGSTLGAGRHRSLATAPPASELYDQDEPFRVPGTWPVICRECSAPLRLEEETPGAWFWRHKSRHLDLQHRADAVPVVTP